MPETKFIETSVEDFRAINLSQAKLDVVLVPLISFDKSWAPRSYGKGFMIVF